MKRTVLIIHGTEGHPEENWFPWLRKILEAEGLKVIIPQFPSPPIVPAKIDEWFDVFNRYKNQLDENSVIVGHSLGGIFTLRILERLDHPVRAVFFTGTPIGVRPIKYYDRDDSFSGFEFDWDKIKNSSKYFAVFHSDNDPYVDPKNGRKLSENLGVDLTLIPGGGHFNKAAGYTKFDKLKDGIVRIFE